MHISKRKIIIIGSILGTLGAAAGIAIPLVLRKLKNDEKDKSKEAQDRETTKEIVVIEKPTPKPSTTTNKSINKTNDPTLVVVNKNDKANNLAKQIQDYLKDLSSEVVVNKSHETAKQASYKILNASSFDVYTNKNLSSITKDQLVTFKSQAQGNDVVVTITVENATAHSPIIYKITNFKTKQAAKADILVTKIKEALHENSIEVANSKIDITAIMAQKQITDAKSFDDFTNKHLANLIKDAKVDFLTEVEGDSLVVTIKVINATKDNLIKYTITGFKPILVFEANQILTTIENLKLGSSGKVTKIKSYETAQEAAKQIVDYQSFALYSDKDLKDIQNIEAVKFYAKAIGNNVKVTLAVPRATKGSIKYTIVGFKSEEAQVADNLVTNIINHLNGEQGEVVQSKKGKETDQEVAKQIVDYQSFALYSGKDLKDIENIEAVKFYAKAIGNNVEVNLAVPRATKGLVKYTIVGFKTEEAQAADNLVAKIIEHLNGVEGEVVQSKKGKETAQEAAKQIVDYQLFTLYSGKNLKDIKNIEVVKFNAKAIDNNVEVTLVVPKSTKEPIKYTIIGFKSEEAQSADNLVAKIIEHLNGVEGEVTTSMKDKETALVAKNNIKDVQSFTLYSGKDLKDIQNIEVVKFQAKAIGNNVEVTLAVPKATREQIKYTIIGFKSEEAEGADNLVTNIVNHLSGKQGEVVQSKKGKETALVAKNNIKDVQSFTLYSGKDLKDIKNIEVVKFQAKAIGNNVEVTLAVPKATRESIKYTIIGFKSEEAQAADNLAAKIIEHLNGDEGEVTASQKGKETAKEATKHIKDAKSFDAYTNKHLTSIIKSHKVTFNANVQGDQVVVLIHVVNATTSNPIKYVINGFKTQITEAADKLVQKIKDLLSGTSIEVVPPDKKGQELASNASDKLKDINSFNFYTNKDLSSITNNNQIIFKNKAIEDKLSVTIKVKNATPGNLIKYTITGFKWFGQAHLNMEQTRINGLIASNKVNISSLSNNGEFNEEIAKQLGIPWDEFNINRFTYTFIKVSNQGIKIETRIKKDLSLKPTPNPIVIKLN